MAKKNYLQFSQALETAPEELRRQASGFVPLLISSGDEAQALGAAADRVRAERLGDAVHLRGLIEFQITARKNCASCGLRRDNRTLDGSVWLHK